MSASDTLAQARTARGAGDVSRCLLLSAAAMQEARDERDAEAEFWACTAPGVMYLSRGEPQDALGHYRFSLDTALRLGLTGLLGAAYHGLYLACRDSENHDAAKRFRATAFELYRDTNARNPRLVALMADWAEGDFCREPSEDTAATALQQMRAVPASLSGARERLYAASNQTVAAAWLGVRSRYTDGALALEQAFADLPDHEGAAVALTHAVRGALRADDFPRALMWADRAVSIATARGEGSVEAQAEVVRTAALAERMIAV